MLLDNNQLRQGQAEAETAGTQLLVYLVQGEVLAVSEGKQPNIVGENQVKDWPWMRRGEMSSAWNITKTVVGQQ